jgi:hypothetical protein
LVFLLIVNRCEAERPEKSVEHPDFDPVSFVANDRQAP